MNTKSCFSDLDDDWGYPRLRNPPVMFFLESGWWIDSLIVVEC